MKKLLIITLALGSTMGVTACSTNGNSANDLDGALTQAPYAEERTVGSSKGTTTPVVRSAEPVFESRQMK